MKNKKAFWGAAFLMATSAIGPGFLTQTSLFTAELLASFGFVILISVLLDIGVQLNIWRIITVRGQRAQDIANELLPGLGYFLAALIAFGGLAFNVGNIGGTGLGMEILTGWDNKWGAVIGCACSLFLFWYKDAVGLMDKVVKVLGLLMLLLTIYVAVSSGPPLGEALYRTVWPEKIDVIKIITIVGGTVGGYISFAGAHRLLDAGVAGASEKSRVTRGAVNGILITSLMRFLLFLAVLGVVSKGVVLAADNPAASAFRAASGRVGYLFFGMVLWIAAVTSVIGASYTSVSFWKTLSPFVRRHEKWVVTAFIVFSTILFLFYGNPVKLLVLAGALNGLILPVALGVLLIAVHKRKSDGYKHPWWLQLAGWIVVGVLSWMGAIAFQQGLGHLF